MSKNSSSNDNYLHDSDSMTFMSSNSLIVRPEQRRKILLLGATNTGKTAYLTRVKQDSFLEYYDPTLVDKVKANQILNKESVEIEFVDLAGLSEYSILSPQTHVFGVNGYILVYSIDDKESFELVESINTKIINLTNPNIPRVLIGTKSDRTEYRQVTFEEGVKLGRRIQCPFYECSAKNGNNIETCTKAILAEINKYETKFNINEVGCLLITKIFMRNMKIRKVYYIMNGLCMICCMFFFVFAFQYYKKCADDDFFLVIGLVFCGAWEILFSVFGILGLYKTKADYLNYNLIATIISIVFNIILFIYQRKHNPENPACDPEVDSLMKKMNTILFIDFICNLTCLLVVLFFTCFYHKIYKKQLYTYIV